MTKDFSIMIYVLTEGKMRILQVTGLQIPLTRVVSIWKTKNKTKKPHDHNSDIHKALLLSLLKI